MTRLKLTTKTGAGHLVNADNIVIYGIAVAILALAACAALFESIEGLLHVAGWYLPENMKWTLAAAVDGFMIGAFIASLALRKRRATKAVIVLTCMVGSLIAFSGVANFLQEFVEADLSTIQGQASPWIKATMPLLAFGAFEAIAMLTSTRNNREASPLNKANATIKAQKATITALKKAASKRAPQWVEGEL